MCSEDIKTFKANLNRELLFVVMFVMLFGIIILRSTSVFTFSWICCICLLIFFLLYHLLVSRITEVKVTSSTLTVIRKNYFVFLKKEEFSLEQLVFSYKKQATSLRSGSRDVCFIYYGGKRVVQLIADQDGWSDSTIHRFVLLLQVKGVRNKLTRRSLKDVNA